MDLEPIQVRLKTKASALRYVGGAAEIPMDDKPPAKRPAGFVYPLTEAAGNNNLAGAVDQRVIVRFAVLLCVTSARARVSQGRTLTELEAVRQSVQVALLNWQPANASDVCTYAGGSLRLMAENALWWQDDYLTAEHWRAT